MTGSPPPDGPPDGVTRRTVLRGAAVAGAAALVDPGAAVARAGGPRLGRVPDVFSRSVGALGAGRESSPIAAPRVFSLAGVEWSGASGARIELRARSVGGGWSPWVIASVLGHDGDGSSAGSQRFGEPVWTGPADQVQLRSSIAVAGVHLHFVALPAVASGDAHAARAFPLAQPILDAGPGQPPIIARGAWAQGRARPTHLPVYERVKLAFVHHSDGANGYGPSEVPSILLGIFAYHVYVRGYWDIAYNFAVDAFGRIWEARAGGIDLPVMGAHAGGYNAESTGMVVLGTFMDVVPSPAAIAALERLLAWKLSLHGVPTLGRVTVEVEPDGAIYTPFAPGSHVSLPRVAGHRDGDTTDCPGNAFYARLPSMRPAIAGLAGAQARLTIAAPAAAVNAGTSVTLTGGLTQVAGGAPLTGATVELQQVGVVRGVTTTIATGTTDDGGGWSFTLTPAQNVLVRVLHRPAPAAVSDVVALGVAPILNLTLESSSPLQVSGTVSPVGSPVTVDLYRVTGGRRHQVASKRVATAGGTFAAGFGARRSGRFVLVARTPATARYDAGASPPLGVTIG
ncbi:MAG TPA: N-acetylmuramoyl-L-alanine amidase [Solirubrobacteraceae bacterium]|nr:N-acetylmuramoyl-L-alanine amidase [Solirubrobacteraceae bacterium]